MKNNCSLMVIYKKYNYCIYQAGDDYIIHNTKYEFKNHHTHINKFSTAKYLINLSIQRSIPPHICDYFIESLIRLADNPEYIDKLNYIKSIDRSYRKGTSVKSNKKSYCNESVKSRNKKK